MLRTLTSAALVYGTVGAVTLSGCHAARNGSGTELHAAHNGSGTERHAGRRRQQERVRHVFCLYDQRPWLNVDTAGDRDPEGIRFRIFLLPQTGRGVLRDGTFHIDMYRIDRKSPDEIERTLVSDWHYPTSAFQPVKAKILGMGYHLRLRWGKKSIPGHEIEVIARFEGDDGNVVRSGTKRLRVPKYTS